MSESSQQQQQSASANKAQGPEFKPPSNWDKMTDQEKTQTWEAWKEWLQKQYHDQYESWMPWIEDHFLKWFTKDNKASYATKDALDKSKVTGIKQVDTLQDGVNNLVAGQVGQGGLAQPIGDMMSKEGINRAERNGKDNQGSYIPTSLPNIPNPLSGLTGGNK